MKRKKILSLEKTIRFFFYVRIIPRKKQTNLLINNGTLETKKNKQPRKLDLKKSVSPSLFILLFALLLIAS